MDQKLTFICCDFRLKVEQKSIIQSVNCHFSLRFLIAHQSVFHHPFSLTYTFSTAGSEGHMFLLNNQMAVWEEKTCIKFKTRTTEKAYIMFTYGKG